MEKRAVIMAGGKGQRLLPYTADTPKPMLPINGKPMLERIIERYEYMGFREIWVAVNHHKEQIKDYFKDRVRYLEEETEMGTAGALSLLPDKSGVTVVQNGDVLCNVNINAVVDFHNDGVTMCAYKYNVEIPYGVIDAYAEPYVYELKEKPYETHLVNSGIYVLDESAMEYLNGYRLDMTDIIDLCLRNGVPSVRFFTMHNVFWLDVGTPEKYLRAQEVIR